MKMLAKFIEKIINIFSYLKIVASPTLIGILIGIIIYSNKTDTVGLFISIIVIACGLILGIIFAKWAKKNGGATELLSNVNATPDIDEIIKKDKK